MTFLVVLFLFSTSLGQVFSQCGDWVQFSWNSCEESLTAESERRANNQGKEFDTLETLTQRSCECVNQWKSPSNRGGPHDLVVFAEISCGNAFGSMFYRMEATFDLQEIWNQEFFSNYSFIDDKSFRSFYDEDWRAEPVYWTQKLDYQGNCSEVIPTLNDNDEVQELLDEDDTDCEPHVSTCHRSWESPANHWFEGVGEEDKIIYVETTCKESVGGHKLDTTYEDFSYYRFLERSSENQHPLPWFNGDQTYFKFSKTYEEIPTDGEDVDANFKHFLISNPPEYEFSTNTDSFVISSAISIIVLLARII